MARVVKDPEIRRNEIIDVAHQLFLTKGYDDTSVQDVLDGAGIAKGTFYHYFDSKLTLLDSIINRLVEQTMASVQPIIADEDMTTIEKMDAYFGTIMQWKTEQRHFFVDFARVLYRDENAVYRQKMMAASMQKIAPVFSTIIRQGITEGVFKTDYPAETAEVIYALLRSLSESLTYILLDEDYEGDVASAFERYIAAYEASIACSLGYDGSLHIFNKADTTLWAETAASTKKNAQKADG